MMVKRIYSVNGVTGAEGTCPEKLRDIIALLASEWNYKEVPARMDRDCLSDTLLKAVGLLLLHVSVHQQWIYFT